MPIKCDPYHTTRPEYGDERNVYHDYNSCPAGSRIKRVHRESGRANRPRCDRCKELD
jgi:hypothetical protein